MNLEPRIDIIASALADPSRVRIIFTLMDGRAFTTKELAYSARVTSQTASFHLKLLKDRDIITTIRHGRNKYHRLANASVASLIESIGLLAPTDHLKCANLHDPKNRVPHQMLLARSCYDHIAGRLSILLAEKLCARGAIVLTGDNYQVLPEGFGFFISLGIEASALAQKTRPLARCCLDWTERRYHMAGSLATALMDMFLETSWITRQRDSRALDITPFGYKAFESHFNLSLAEVHGTIDVNQLSLSA